MMTVDNTSKRNVFFIFFFLGLFILGTFLMFVTPSTIKINYGLTTETKDGELISFNVFEPHGGDTRKKAIIIGHGVLVNKEMVKGYAIELANAGFIAVTLDFRGHGQSTGELNSKRLFYDIKAVKNYLKNRDDVDLNDFGYLGYSMGGDPGQKVIRSDKDFKCFIGVGTPLSLTYEHAANRSLNVLMMVARYDEGTRQNDLKTQFGELVNVHRNNIVFNRLYGSFKDGNAAKVVIDDNSDHISTAWDADFIREARDWVINTFPDVEIVDENFYTTSSRKSV